MGILILKRKKQRSETIKCSQRCITTQLISKSICNFHLLCVRPWSTFVCPLFWGHYPTPWHPPDTRQQKPNPLSLQPPASFHPVRLYFTPLPVLSRYLCYKHCQSAAGRSVDMTQVWPWAAVCGLHVVWSPLQDVCHCCPWRVLTAFRIVVFCVISAKKVGQVGASSASTVKICFSSFLSRLEQKKNLINQLPAQH